MGPGPLLAAGPDRAGTGGRRKALVSGVPALEGAVAAAAQLAEPAGGTSRLAGRGSWSLADGDRLTSESGSLCKDVSVDGGCDWVVPWPPPSAQQRPSIPASACSESGVG